MSIVFCGKTWPSRTARLSQPIDSMVDLSPLGNLTYLTDLNLRNSQGDLRDFLAQLTDAELVQWDSLLESGLSEPAAKVALRGGLDLGPLGTCRRLTTLYLDGTLVSDLTPLAKLTQLYWIRLNNTHVVDLSPLSELTQLRWLHLNHTPIQSLEPLCKLTQLYELYIHETAIGSAERDRLQAAIPKLTIYHSMTME